MSFSALIAGFDFTESFSLPFFAVIALKLPSASFIFSSFSLSVLISISAFGRLIAFPRYLTVNLLVSPSLSSVFSTSNSSLFSTSASLYTAFNKVFPFISKDPLYFKPSKLALSFISSSLRSSLSKTFPEGS